MRNALLVLALATAGASAQDKALLQKLRRAVVHIQTTDRALEQAERLRQARAPIAELRRCVIQQPYTMVVSGVAISPGEILTVALHPRADLRVLVTYQDGRQIEANLVGTDPLSNLALLEVPEKSEDFLALNEEAIRLKENVSMVGFEAGRRDARPIAVRGSVDKEQRPLRIRDMFGVTRNGVITLGSAFTVATTEGRPNVGSACVDEKGNLVGLVVGGMPHIEPDPDQPGRIRAVEIRFAVPAARIARIVGDLRTHGRVIRAQFGVLVQPVGAAMRAQFDLPVCACSVTWLRKGGPMARAGVQIHDVILKIDGKRYKDTHQLGEAMTEKTPGKPVTFELLRAGKTVTVSVTPTEWR